MHLPPGREHACWMLSPARALHTLLMKRGAHTLLAARLLRIVSNEPFHDVKFQHRIRIPAADAKLFRLRPVALCHDIAEIFAVKAWGGRYQGFQINRRPETFNSTTDFDFGRLVSATSTADWVTGAARKEVSFRLARREHYL